MPPKFPTPPKKFEGEGNPIDVIADVTVLPTEIVIRREPVASKPSVLINDAERDVLKKVLDRDRTSKIVHGGLKSILSLNDDETTALLNFLRRI
jgi:hypothetical protein